MHSCHCYFLLAGSADVPILFHVERVRDGRSFATRTVQARQRGRCIFTSTISFVREGSGGRDQVRHAVPLPAGVEAPAGGDGGGGDPAWASSGPFQSRQIEVLGVRDPGSRPEELKCRQWIRARGTISEAGGHQAHLNALAYMSDSYFIGTVSRIHRLWRFPFAPEDVPSLPAEVRAQIEQVGEFEGMGSRVEDWVGRPRVGMLVSLDHSIYFHEPLKVKADEWMFTEMESPWSGDGRGVVMQRMFSKDGTLVATCVQEVSGPTTSVPVAGGEDRMLTLRAGRREAEAGRDREERQDVACDGVMPGVAVCSEPEEAGAEPRAIVSIYFVLSRVRFLQRCSRVKRVTRSPACKETIGNLHSTQRIVSCYPSRP